MVTGAAQGIGCTAAHDLAWQGRSGDITQNKALEPMYQVEQCNSGALFVFARKSIMVMA